MQSIFGIFGLTMVDEVNEDGRSREYRLGRG
jgi:hypothetical protein